MYENNLWYIYGMHSIGKGLQPSEKLNAILNLPPTTPPQKTLPYAKKIKDATKAKLKLMF